MPGLYGRGHFDLAGFAVGAVERGGVLPRTRPDRRGRRRPRASPRRAIHANGFSLVRLVLREQGLKLADPCPWQAGRSLGDTLLTPTRIYVASCLAAIAAGGVKALAHITGGGLVENPPRVLADGQVLHLDLAAWPLPPVFAWLARAGRLERHGAAAYLQLRHRHDPGGGARAGRGGRARALEARGETVRVIGRIGAASGRPRVEFVGLDTAWPGAAPPS